MAELELPRETNDIRHLRDLSPQQWKSGIAAWLGWLFDGLDMHLYTLVATPFVAELLAVQKTNPDVGLYGSWIQAAFLVGWALGGGFFGRIGDRLGRSKALILTILTYAAFTGLSYFAQTWWHLLIFRFLAALGIGGEWAVGASLLSETWPKRWRPWMAAVLQTGVNCGVLLATLANFLLADQHRYVFLVGVLPALLVLWIRKAVPEPEEWHAAKRDAQGAEPRIRDLFRGSVRKITILTILVCSLSLTAHWAFLFWYLQHFRSLMVAASLSEADAGAYISKALAIVMVASIAGNFVAAAIAKMVGYRMAIALLCIAYFCSMLATYSVPRDFQSLFYFLPLMGVAQGVFALFTMYLPPLFPTLLRTTGAGFCYNIGRIVAAAGTVLFGLMANPDTRQSLQSFVARVFGGDYSTLVSEGMNYRYALLYAGFLFLPAALVSLFMPEPPDERAPLTPLE